jgi:hypothetical protein
MGKKRNAYRILVGKPEEKRPPGIPRRRRVDIKIDLIERQDGMVWTGSIWLRIGGQWRAVVNTVTNFRVP